MPATKPLKLITAAPAGGDRLSLSLPVRANFRVDREKGEIIGVSLITGDREATGHGLYIDQRTLETGMDSVRDRGGKLKVGIRHPTMSDWWSRNEDRSIDVPGFYSDIELRGNQLVAGRVQFFDTFKAQQPEAFARLMEMAEKAPELFGLSIEAYGYAVYVDEDGNEYSEKPVANSDGEGVALKYDGMPAFRMVDLSAAAFVDEPAANKGLFAAFARKVGLDRILGGGEREQLEGLRGIAQAFVEFASRNDFASAQNSEDRRHAQSNDSTTQSEMSLIAAIKAKFGSDKKKHERALALLADVENPTIEVIEQKMAAPDSPPAATDPEQDRLGAIRTRFGADAPRLKRAFAVLAEHEDFTAEQIAAHLSAEDAAEVKRLREENARLQKEADKAKSDFAALKNSGHGVNLGAGATAGAAPGGEQKELKGRSRVAAAFAAQVSGRN